MRLDDRLEKQKKQEEKRRKFAFDDEDEETLTYMQRPKSHYINEDSGMFERFDKNSINTQKSVFDRTAIFRTTQDQRGEMP